MSNFFNIKKIFYTLIVSIILVSCVPRCEEYSCVSGDYRKVRFLNKVDSSSLFFCSNKKYEIKDVLFYSKGSNGYDTVHPHIRIDYNFKNSSCDSLLELYLPYYSSTKLYIKYSASEIDSFEYKINKSSNKCCKGEVNEVYDFSQHLQILQDDSISVYTIYK